MEKILKRLGLRDENNGIHDGSSGGMKKCEGKRFISYSPIDGSAIAEVISATPSDYEYISSKARRAFDKWSSMPAPKRGEIIRQIGNRLREHEEDLASLITLETGKILPESRGEVREMTDISDFALGQSRMLYGRTMHSERKDHTMKEQYHPMGPAGVITAFNFPVAVWAWNSLLGGVCGNTVIWKPSEKAVLCAIAVQNIIAPVIDENGLSGVFNMIADCDSSAGKMIASDKNVPLVSATGSVRMGRDVGVAVASRFGRSILELGGNNAVIVDETADIDLAVKSVYFGSVGTAGQRCTSTRRLLIERSVKDVFMAGLVAAYESTAIGDPFDKGTVMGPLIDGNAVDDYHRTIEEACASGGELIIGNRSVTVPGREKGHYVFPSIIECDRHNPSLQREAFAPILYVVGFDDFGEAVKIQNDVPQGLSSALFSNDIHREHLFLSHRGSDCGIANVNAGTSGAEIGGAFGGEKETGGGRESGSDAWRSYMRRQTSTVNWGDSLHFAQGVEFKIKY